LAPNPLRTVDATRRRHRRTATPWVLRVRDLLLPLVALAVLVPLVQTLFLGFLQAGAEGWAAGVGRVLLRVTVVVVGWLSLDTFSALIRADDRSVLAILPVDGAHVVASALERVARRRWIMVPAFGVLLSPLLVHGAQELWALALVQIAGAWALGLTVSTWVHLLAIEVSESERWAPWLDLVRGNNPRPQAAFLYAPGVALLACGLLLARSAEAVAGSASGLWLVVPFVVAGAAALPLPSLARRTWFRGSAVLAEIDARYAALLDPEEGRRVYLDWVVRWLPAPLRLHALHDLRHGWRARRTLITGAWLVGLAGLVSAWTSDPAGVGRAAVVSVLGVWACGAVSVLLAADEPPFLERWLGVSPGRQAGARLVVTALWLQPCLWPAVGAVALRHGLGPAARLLAWGELGVVGAGLLALACSRLTQRRLSLYGPLAAVLGALFVAGGPT